MKLLDTIGNFSVMNIILISVVSKLLYTILTYFMLTFKTLFQRNESKSNREILDILAKLFENEGIRGFFKGILKYVEYI